MSCFSPEGFGLHLCHSVIMSSLLFHSQKPPPLEIDYIATLLNMPLAFIRTLEAYQGLSKYLNNILPSQALEFYSVSLRSSPSQFLPPSFVFSPPNVLPCFWIYRNPAPCPDKQVNCRILRPSHARGK